MKKRFAGFVFLFFASMSTHVVAEEALLLPVPMRTVFAGQSLDEAELTVKLFYVSESSRRNYVFENEQLDRMEAARTLPAGKPILLNAIKKFEDVKKGRPLKAVYQSGVIEIQGLLSPTSSGSIGQVIEARNTTSGGIVKVEISSNGTLMVIGK